MEKRKGKEKKGCNVADEKKKVRIGGSEMESN
jgi:hypothetical protein